ncbi:unnamed protein product [Hymenolepis diminuta]|uniref:Dynein light chain n=1 Tax=Hymenolepis diminuta TaxID=6216 RepID=A0A564YXX3_HYMDI|nr:unnamed protein product [Hymenolepis diminuta]
MKKYKALIKYSDMPEEMQKRSLTSANEAMKYHVLEKDIAGHIKREFDMRYGATWHCIVGRSYGSFVTHENNNFIYFFMNTVAILLFKSG